MYKIFSCSCPDVFYRPIYSCLQCPINRGSAWMPRLEIKKKKSRPKITSFFHVTLTLNKLQQNSKAKVNSVEKESKFYAVCKYITLQWRVPYQYLIILQRKSCRRGKALSTLDVCSSLLHNLSAAALALGLYMQA